ncbi:MAG: replicative DNA helicase [Clostridiales bacterium]|nr:replicative DNA helicase [Clostridiales bacterium]
MAKSSENIISGRVPPQSSQAEQAVLCACLDNEQAMTVALSTLQPDDFYHPGHRLIYKAILQLTADRNAVDIITVSEQLRRSGELESVGGTAYISQLSDLMIIRANVAEYASIVRQKAMLRRLIHSLDGIIKQSYEGDQEASNLVDIAIQRLSELRENPVGRGFESISEILSRTLQEIMDISRGKKDRKVVRTGFPKLDQSTGGLRPGSLVIVAARPAMGKSALVVNIATNTSIIYNTHVAFFSLEMSKEEIGNRILSSKAAISTFKLQNANVSNKEWEEISKALTMISSAPFYIDDRSGINTIEMMAKCRQLKNENRLGLVVVDYMQLMSPAGGRSYGNRQQEISDISRSLKIMAKELNVPVIALSQLSRGAESREEHRPILSDLRDSGAIEQDADMVIFIYRPKYYDPAVIKPDIEDAEIILAKNRQGPTKTVHMKWWPKRTLFFEQDAPGDPETDSEITREAPPAPDEDESDEGAVFGGFEKFVE